MTTVQRINFLKQTRRGLTYRLMLLALIVWVLILAAASTGGYVHQWYLNQELAHERLLLQKLGAKKDERLALVEIAGKQQHAEIAQKEIATIFSALPAWASVLDDLAKRLPAKLWLKSIRATRDPTTDEHRMNLVGRGWSARIVTNFVLRLEDSRHFKDVKLVETKQLAEGGGVFDFTIASAVETQ